MSGDQARRLAKVTNILAARGCPACRHWDTTEMVIVSDRLAASGGESVTYLPRPERCPDCGRKPPRTTAVVQIIAPDDEDAEVLT